MLDDFIFLDECGCISTWKHTSKVEIFKDKIRQILISRMMGDSKETFEPYEPCTTNFFYSSLVPFGYFGCFQFTDDEWKNFFKSYLSEEEQKLMCFVYETSDNVSLYNLEHGDSERQSVERDYLEEIAEFYELGSEQIDDAIELLKDYNTALNTGTTSNPTIRSFAEAIASHFDSTDITWEFVLKNFNTMGNLLTANENNQIETFVYSSKEVYYYEEYKHKLPADLRKVADVFIDVFKNPFPQKCHKDFYFSITCDTLEEEKSVIVAFSYTQKCSSNEAFVEDIDTKLFFRDALNFVGKELPNIRARYGNGLVCSHAFFMPIFNVFCIFLRVFVLAFLLIFNVQYYLCFV